MTPLEVTVRVLAEHQRVIGMPMATCACGWAAPLRHRPAHEIHAAHLADRLAAAGLVPTVQEWGVRTLTGTTDEDVYPHRTRESAEEQAARWFSELRPEVVSRWTGATAWLEVGE